MRITSLIILYCFVFLLSIIIGGSAMVLGERINNKIQERTKKLEQLIRKKREVRDE